MKQVAGWMLLTCLAAPAWAEPPSYTVRSTEIKKKPFVDAPSVATLAEKSSVTVLQRQGGWVRINSEQGSGWVKMLNLRNSNTQSGDSGIQSLFNVGRTGSSGVTVATGVRGLSAEELAAAQPNFVELAKLKNYTVDKNQATKFAQNGKLKSQSQEFIPAN